MRLHKLVAAGLACVSQVSACAATSGSSAPQAGNTELAMRWRYEARLSSDLTSLDATICFEGPTPRELRAGKDEAASRLRHARWISPGAIRGLPVRNGRIQLGHSVDNGCVAYRVDLREGGNLGAEVRHLGRSVLASPNIWLWRPEPRAVDGGATLALELSEGQTASLPWPMAADGKRFALDSDAFEFDSRAAFGRLRQTRGEHRGVRFEAALLDAASAPNGALVESWMRSAIDLARTGPGGFPTSRLHALLVPAATDGEPVTFGSVTRGGAGSVLLFVSPTASLPSLERDWVLPHELSHLFLPYVARAHAWFSEGAATYYQEVLRARGGVISSQDALLNIARSTRSAAQEGTGRLLRDESRDMFATRAFRSVYWAGAAYFLMADVELRRTTGGKATLDTVLEALRNGGHRRSWETLDELLAQMDAIAGTPVFEPLANRCLGQAFPDVEPVLAELGVRADGDEFSVVDEAKLATVRDAIFRVRGMTDGEPTRATP
jgi:hypothetical protein